MAVAYAYRPAPFQDAPSRQGDVEDAEVPLAIVAQCMGFVRYEEAAAFELIKHLPVHPAVGQRIPCAGVLWRGHFTELRPADEFCSAVKQHSFGWLLGCHGPFDQCVHFFRFCGLG